MADTKISNLPAVTTVDDTDEYVLARSGGTKKITGANLKAGTAASASGAAGGVLSGTYPNPGFAVDMATQAELDAVAAGTATDLDDLTDVNAPSPSDEQNLSWDAGASHWRPRTAVLPTIVDAKGDLIVGSANDAVDNLAAGTNGHVLTADSTQTLGLKWAAAPAPDRVMEIKVIDDATVLTTGDGKVIICVPAAFNGMNLTGAHAAVTTVSSSGLPTVQLRNVTDSVDMLSTKISIDASEFTSYTAATAPVIDTSKDDVATGDLIAVDVDVAGTGAKGLIVILTFQLP
jgi:hypothetical protein